jgi:hypothetical protein
MAPDALYWLGESLFQRQRYRDAAESFLTVSTKHETTGKAPDALLRLGQSLAALGEKDTACATLGEVSRKYPRASLSVKQGVEREQKRVRCCLKRGYLGARGRRPLLAISEFRPCRVGGVRRRRLHRIADAGGALACRAPKWAGAARRNDRSWTAGAIARRGRAGRFALPALGPAT